MFQVVQYGVYELVVVEWFFNEIGSVFFEGFDGNWYVIVVCEEYDWQCYIGSFEMVEGF